ncbi:hypothetical protein GCM10025779_20530 [Arthrobacter cryoconiti]
MGTSRLLAPVLAEVRADIGLAAGCRPTLRGDGTAIPGCSPVMGGRSPGLQQPDNVLSFEG